MTTKTEFRCYYDDGTIDTVAEVCPAVNQHGSPLIKSELQIIEDVVNEITFPWLLLVLGLVALFSRER